MIVTARALRERTRQMVRERIKMCEKRGGVSASLFLDTQLNDALPQAKCLFFFGRKRKWKGMLSVFYPTEREAEFTVALAQPDERVLPALFRAAIKECRKYLVEEIYTVVNPTMNFTEMGRCGGRLTYAYSEYFLCQEAQSLIAAVERQKDMERGTGIETEKSTSADITLTKSGAEGEPARYCLSVEGEEAAECFLSPFDSGTGWYLYHLETKEEYRRQGFATRLIREVAREIAAQGAKVLRLQVSSKNVPAERLYRKLGFQTEEQRDYYKTENA